MPRTDPGKYEINGMRRLYDAFFAASRSANKGKT